MSPPWPPTAVECLAALGPYFALRSQAPGPGWRPASALIDDGEHLAEVIDNVAARLGTGQRWIAASVFYQGWAARLTAIYAGSAALFGAAPDLRVPLVTYRPRGSAPVDLSVAPLRPLSTDAAWRYLSDDHLVPLAAAIRRQVRIGGYLLRGNVASALAGALDVLSQAHRETLDSLLRRGWAQPADLAECGHWLSAPGGPRYARSTCCGYEQLEQGGRCGDCSLNWLGTAASQPFSSVHCRPPRLCSGVVGGVVGGVPVRAMPVRAATHHLEHLQAA